jgi:hypothetical protein
VPADGYQGVGLLAFLLPHVEQEAVFRNMSFVDWNVDNYQQLRWVDDPSGLTLTMATSRLKVFLCPSDNPYAARGRTLSIIHTYPSDMEGFFVLGYRYWASTDAGDGYADRVGRTNYVGVSGNNGMPTDAYLGLFYNRSSVSLAQAAAADGTSNTLMLGETLGGETAGPRTFSLSWMVGAFPVTRGLPEVIGSADGGWYTFSSRHTGVVQFCFGDGSVHALRKGTTRAQLRSLAGWRDGEVIDNTLFN